MHAWEKIVRGLQDWLGNKPKAWLPAPWRTPAPAIGVAQSTLDEGIISHVNEPGTTLGVRLGQTCKDVVMHLQHTGSTSLNNTGDTP